MKPIIEGTAAYIDAHPDGLGATLDAAMRASAEVRHVVVCGARPPSVRRWCASSGGWLLLDTPYVTSNALRVTAAAEGRTVHVTRAAAWFGDGVAAETVAHAMRVMRHVAGAVGAHVVATPGRTGLAMLRAGWAARGQDWPSPAPELAELLRSTSGQGRFQIFPASAAAAEQGRPLVKVDARFQYAALAQLDLPAGEPVELVGVAPDAYAPSWCEVEFVPAGSVAMLGVWQGDRTGWAWPTEGGPYVTWASGAELFAARRAGYSVRVRRAIVWPERARPLRAWAAHLVRERERIGSMPLSADVVAAARAGIRSMLVQALGMLHGRPPMIQHAAEDVDQVPPEAVGVRRVGGRWYYDMPGTPPPIAHPEWTVMLWAMARQRLAVQLTNQTAPLVAAALDAYYVAGEPVTGDDDGRPGRWRVAGRWERWPAPRTMTDLWRLADG